MTAGIPDDLLTSIASGDPVDYAEIKQLGLDINASGVTHQRTLLMAAAYGNRADLIRLLVSDGAMVDRGNGIYGMAALHEAAWNGNINATTALLDLGANIDVTCDDETTPLMFAASSGECSAVRLLLSRGADVNRVDKHGFNALMMAIEKCQDEAASILEAAGSRVSDVE
jgi:ankyrin repeat protein